MAPLCRCSGDAHAHEHPAEIAPLRAAIPGVPAVPGFARRGCRSWRHSLSGQWSPAIGQLGPQGSTLSNTQTFNNVVPGSGYSLAESVPSGWDQTSATCSDGSPITNINVSADETVTCTFSNRKRGQINVVEDSVPNDAQDFAFTIGFVEVAMGLR